MSIELYDKDVMHRLEFLEELKVPELLVTIKALSYMSNLDELAKRED